jgi:hypothetical protein
MEAIEPALSEWRIKLNIFVDVRKARHFGMKVKGHGLPGGGPLTLGAGGGDAELDAEC